MGEREDQVNEKERRNVFDLGELELITRLSILSTTEVYFPSLTSLEQRTVLAYEYDAGVSIWDLGQGLNYFSRVL